MLTQYLILIDLVESELKHIQNRIKINLIHIVIYQKMIFELVFDFR
jgi:hypothetical protein